MDNNKAYDGPIKIDDGIFWVGFRAMESNLHCNPYLVVQDGQAVLIDSGSRTDFATVMMKILQVGIDPKQIVALIYQHYDPDLCGSMSNFIDMCDNPNLEVFSEMNNNVFISFYVHREKRGLLKSIDENAFMFTFNNRTLQFFTTPYSHSQGSFVTYDEKTKTLFSSDLFGSFSTKWELELTLDDECFTCEDYDHCPRGKDYCPLPDLIAFHRKVMPCNQALRYAMGKIRDIDMEKVAPQHGSILTHRRDIYFIIEQLEGLDGVGIDGVIQRSYP